MTITIELPPDIEDRFVAKATERGVPVAQLLKELLVLHKLLQLVAALPAIGDLDQGFDEAADLIPEEVPALTCAAMGRESIYSREDDWNR